MIVSLAADEIRLVLADLAFGHARQESTIATAALRCRLLRKIRKVRNGGDDRPRRRVNAIYSLDTGYRLPRKLKDYKRLSRRGSSSNPTVRVRKVEVASPVRSPPIVWYRPRCVASTRRGTRCKKSPVTVATWDRHVALCAIHKEWARE